MDRVHLMSVFVSVAEHGGFAAASRALNTSAPSVTRAIASLEEHLGVPLFVRSTRHVRLTDAGRRYLEDARAILLSIEAAQKAVAGVHTTPKGHLSITAPVLFGHKFVLPCVVDYLKKYPETEVSTMFLDRVVNLLDEGMDIGVRIGELPDSNLQAIRVGTVRLLTVASPKYLEQRGCPDTPMDLRQHTIVSSSAGTNALSWRYAEVNSGRPIQLKPRLRVTTNDAAIEAAKKHLGITRLLSYQLHDHIRSGKLRVISPEYEPAPRPVHIVHRESHRAPANIRTLLDELKLHLRKSLGKLHHEFTNS